MSNFAARVVPYVAMLGLVLLLVVIPACIVSVVRDAHRESDCRASGGVWVDHTCIDRSAVIAP